MTVQGDFDGSYVAWVVICVVVARIVVKRKY